MRRNVLTIVLVVVVLFLFIGLNAVFLAQPQEEETEQTGNRSSYKGTRYGTLAYYSLLSEMGFSVSRFEAPFTELATSSVGTLFVVTPRAEHQPTEVEFLALQEWVADGGRLVVVDRDIYLEFTEPSLAIRTRPLSGEGVTPRGPSVFTQGVKEIRVTPFASTISLTPNTGTEHFAGTRGPLVVDTPFGDGHITLVSESHVIENEGIAEADNVILAVNLARGLDDAKAVAFDEYHHGYGSISGEGGGLRDYIAGTPVPWILAQIALIAIVVSLTVGARFARAVPVGRERRTSALEFVSSMATVQRLAQASELAIENIYGPFRMRLCRFANLPPKTPVDTLATTAARKARINMDPVLAVLRRCDEILAGSPCSPEELLHLVAEIRKIEAKLRL
jgi:hypothetical protein